MGFRRLNRRKQELRRAQHLLLRKGLDRFCSDAVLRPSIPVRDVVVGGELDVPRTPQK